MYLHLNNFFSKYPLKIIHSTSTQNGQGEATTPEKFPFPPVSSTFRLRPSIVEPLLSTSLIISFSFAYRLSYSLIECLLLFSQNILPQEYEVQFVLHETRNPKNQMQDKTLLYKCKRYESVTHNWFIDSMSHI